MQWADNAGMETVPVLSDSSQSVWISYEHDFYIPTVVHLGPDMTVLSGSRYAMGCICVWLGIQTLKLPLDVFDAAPWLLPGSASRPPGRALK